MPSSRYFDYYSNLINSGYNSIITSTGPVVEMELGDDLDVEEETFLASGESIVYKIDSLYTIDYTFNIYSGSAFEVNFYDRYLTLVESENSSYSNGRYEAEIDLDLSNNMYYMTISYLSSSSSGNVVLNISSDHIHSNYHYVYIF